MTTIIDKNLLKATLTEIFLEFGQELQIDNDAHIAQHAWLKERIEAEQARKDMFIAIRNAALQWSIAFILSGAVAWFNGWLKL